MCQFLSSPSVGCRVGLQRLCLLGNRKSPMIFLHSPNHGCVYTLSQEDGDELYFAPIYINGTINLEEFTPVDMNAIDMDEMELFDIRNRLVAMSNI